MWTSCLILYLSERGISATNHFRLSANTKLCDPRFDARSFSVQRPASSSLKTIRRNVSKALFVRDLYMQFRTLNSLVNFRKITRNSSLEYWIKRFKVNGILISEKPAQEIWVELSRLGFHWIRFKRNRADKGGLLLQNDRICGSLSPLFRTRNPHRLSQSSSEFVWTQKSLYL